MEKIGRFVYGDLPSKDSIKLTEILEDINIRDASSLQGGSIIYYKHFSFSFEGKDEDERDFYDCCYEIHFDTLFKILTALGKTDIITTRWDLENYKKYQSKNIVPQMGEKIMLSPEFAIVVDKIIDMTETEQLVITVKKYAMPKVRKILEGLDEVTKIS